MANYGMKISKDGGDVKTAVDKDLVMTSKFNQIKVSAQGTFTVVVPANTASATTNIAHGLGYAPGYLIFLEEVAGDGKKRPLNFRGTNDLRANSGGTNVSITVNYPIGGTFGTNKTHNGYYFIFVDEV